MIGFEGGGRRMTTRLIAGEFIRYRSRFPDGFGCRAEVPADLFSEAVRRVSLVAERGSPVRLAFGAGKLVIEAGTEGQARAVETVTADFHGDEPVISFNPHYLLDGLAAAAVSAAPGPADAASGAPAASAGAAGSHGSSGTSGTAPADEGRAAGAVSPGGPRRIRLEFTSPVKPAVLTGLPAAADAGDDADDIGGEGAAGGADEGAAPDFRYLVVPLRVPARQ